ncbi:MAG: hypothetical protein IJJ13_06880 [Lachnospiraceae bacterium]|nr:hypothetical protein [Lachnospiraceae bacterium]
MKNISTGTLAAIISMCSVVVFFVWGWLDTYQHSWIVFMICGIAIAAVSMIRKDKDKAAKADSEEENKE